MYYLNEFVSISFDGAAAIATTKDADDADYFYSPEGLDADEPYLTIVAYGDIYNFRAKENLYLVSIFDEDEFALANRQEDETSNPSQVYVRTVANVNNDTHSLVTYNAIVLPKDYKIVEAGLIAQYNKTGADLIDRDKLDFNEVGKDQGNDKVRRLKSTKIVADEDNRFTITLNLAAGANVKYRAYVNYTDDQGASHSVFADVSDQVTIG
jgi:hypothetical protein